MIERYSREDVEPIARLHVQELGGTLSELGSRAVEAYYSAALASTDTIGFVARDGHHIQGIVFGSLQPARLKREILQRKFPTLGFALAGHLLRKPRVAGGLLRALTTSAPDYDASCPELTYLAVAPDGRRGGCGTHLVEAFDASLSQRGATRYELSVGETNAGAIGFYERLGLREVGAYEEFGVHHRRYRKELPQDERG